jgi:hypothetical protein
VEVVGLGGVVHLGPGFLAKVSLVVCWTVSQEEEEEEPTELETLLPVVVV